MNNNDGRNRFVLRNLIKEWTKNNYKPDNSNLSSNKKRSISESTDSEFSTDSESSNKKIKIINNSAPRSFEEYLSMFQKK